MAVHIRMKRMGGSNRDCFRIVATDSRFPRDGRFLEALGWYDPRRPGRNFELKAERVAHWKSQGATLSDTVRSLVRKMQKPA